MIGTNGQALTELQRRFWVWRGRRPQRRRIPEELWQAAVHAARQHGLWKAARHLRVDYYSLKQRLTRASAPAVSTESVEFVEIPQKVLSSGPACVVELQDPRGLRLRVELRDPSGAEALARALWSQRG
jgi:hypothetical protein